MLRSSSAALLWAVFCSSCVTLVTYVLFFLVPVDPARLAAGKSATAEDVERVKHDLELDRPVYVAVRLVPQALVVDQSLGNSYANRRDVNEMVAEAAPVDRRPRLRRRHPLDADRAADRDPLRAEAAIALRQIVDGVRPHRDLGARRLDRHPAAVLHRLQAGLDRRTPATATSSTHPRAPRAAAPWDWFTHMILPWITFAILFAASYVRMIRVEHDGHAR